MARPRSYRTEAVVLKSSPFGEGGLIVTLFSRDAGKLRAVVRGARRPTSKMVGHLEPLNRVELFLARPRIGGMDTITQAQVAETFAPLKADLEALSRAIYLTELTDGFSTEDSANPELYTLLIDTLRFLCDAPGVELASRYFELHLLKSSGFMPELYRCVECRHELSPGQHLFSPEAGGTLCPQCHPAGVRIFPLSLQCLKILRFMDRGTLTDLTSLRVQNEQQEEVENLLSATLKYWLDREIQSKSFIEHLERTRNPGVYITGG